MNEKCRFSDLGLQTFFIAFLDKSSRRKILVLEPEKFYFLRKKLAKLAKTEKMGRFVGP